MTVTNYTGDARDYLKKLLAMLGVEATPALKRSETEMCIAALYVLSRSADWVYINANPFPYPYSKSGPKTERAEEWGIPIVNHLWVEECFKRWTFVHPAAESGRFVSYPPGINYAEILGQRGIGNVRREALNLAGDTPNPQQSKKISRTGNAMDLDSEGPIASTSK